MVIKLAKGSIVGNPERIDLSSRSKALQTLSRLLQDPLNKQIFDKPIRVIGSDTHSHSIENHEHGKTQAVSNDIKQDFSELILLTFDTQNLSKSVFVGGIVDADSIMHIARRNDLASLSIVAPNSSMAVASDQIVRRDKDLTVISFTTSSSIKNKLHVVPRSEPTSPTGEILRSDDVHEVLQFRTVYNILDVENDYIVRASCDAARDEALFYMDRYLFGY